MMSAIRYISKIYIDYVSSLTYDSLCLAHRGAFSRDDPEGGARCGVLRRRLVTAPREVRDTARQALYDLAARSSLHGLRRKCRRRKRGPRPKIATVERREASAPIARCASRPLARHKKPMRLAALRPPLAGRTLFHDPGAIAPRE